MPRAKKQRPTLRSDGRYVCRYKDQYFYSTDPDDCIQQREDYKERERRGQISTYYMKDYAVQWLDRSHPNVSPSTKKGLSTHLKTLIKAIGEKPISEVKPSDIKAIYSEHYRNLSNSYIKAAKQLFCSLFDSAVADGLIISNPARNRTAKPHKGTFGGHRAITRQEREWIETLCTDHRAYPVAMAMLYSGIRPQEAKALNIDKDIDFDAEIITVRNTAHYDPENQQRYVITNEGKTEKANRQIPLLPPLKAALIDKHGPLVTTAHGKQITHTTWHVMWNSYRNCMERAINGVDRRWYGRTREHKKILAAGGKLPEWISFDIVPYDLRHSFVTMLRDMKPPIEIHTAIAWMGHADAKMILSIYDSVTDDRDRSEAERLKKIMKGEG